MPSPYMAALTRAAAALRHHHLHLYFPRHRLISTSPALFQEPQLQDPTPPDTNTTAGDAATPLPPIPDTTAAAAADAAALDSPIADTTAAAAGDAAALDSPIPDTTAGDSPSPLPPIHDTADDAVTHLPPDPNTNTATTSLPPNPATGSPLYHDSAWRTPAAAGLNNLLAGSISPLSPLAIPASYPSPHIRALARTLDGPEALMNVFADWMPSQRWHDLKELFEVWVRSVDKNGKPNRPDVSLYNLYLRAGFMMGASAGELLDVVAQMDDFDISPNTASFNMVLKLMFLAREIDAAEQLLNRMMQTGKEALPDGDSYNMVIELLLSDNRIDSALKYLDMTLRSGYELPMSIFQDCVRNCVKAGRLDTLATFIERCKTMDQNKALSPNWNSCYLIVEAALQADHSKLAFYGLEFLARWMVQNETRRPPMLFSVDEGVAVAALGTAARTYDNKLIDASWEILRRSLRKKGIPGPNSYLGKIHAHASLGNLQRAFSTLRDFETAYDNSSETDENFFSPFTSLYPLVVACSKEGFSTLDSVYYQLENLSRADTPYKSVAALNCVILGCANIWDLDRAYQTFESISGTFGLTPDINSYNALMSAFGKLKKTHEAARVFDHLTSLGVKPNAMSYSLLVDAHLINRDQKSALAALEEMLLAGHCPSKELLQKVRRRCVRECDDENVYLVESLFQRFNYRSGGENRKQMLFSLEYGSEYP